MFLNHKGDNFSDIVQDNFAKVKHLVGKSVTSLVSSRSSLAKKPHSIGKSNHTKIGQFSQ